jgi:hypothetical protein
MDLPRNDRGSGELRHYRYSLVPNNARVVIRLADSAPHQAELATIATSTGLETALSFRTTEDERTDAPMPVRLFTGSRVSDVVGLVPRGLESIVDDTLRRLDRAGRKARIPVRVVKTRGGLRVDLLMGQTR